MLALLEAQRNSSVKKTNRNPKSYPSKSPCLCLRPETKHEEEDLVLCMRTAVTYIHRQHFVMQLTCICQYIDTSIHHDHAMSYYVWYPRHQRSHMHACMHACFAVEH